MADGDDTRAIPSWYMLAAVASLLFMGLGCVSYLMHVLADPGTMTIEQRTAYDAEPVWVTAAYAVAVWGGLAGAILLVMRQRLAPVALALSLAGVLVWLAGLLVVSGMRENMSANDLIVAIVVTAVTWTIFWFGRQASQRGWLR